MAPFISVDHCCQHCVQAHASWQPFVVIGVEPPVHDALHAPAPQLTVVPAHDSMCAPHSMVQFPLAQRKSRSPQPSFPSQTSVHA
jgi:hypothetical protein